MNCVGKEKKRRKMKVRREELYQIKKNGKERRKMEVRSEILLEKN